MILKLTNNKNTYSFEVEDLNNGEKLFYHFQIPTADMEDGKYNMVLLDGDEIVAEEQVCIGAYNPQAIQYSRGENVYINAPFEANLEDVKEVEITAINTTVLPSEGYDGIKAVEVNAQPIYDEGYNIGNAEGIEVGKAEQKALLEPITITENGTYENENGYSTIEVNVPDVNGSYDEGYTDGYAEGEAKGVENAGSIIAETARVLDITENGVYKSKYSDKELLTPITGTYPNGDNFYDYAYISKRGYNTGIYPSPTTKIEFWWRFDGTIEEGGYGEGVVIGAHKWGYVESVFKVGFNFKNEKMVAAIGSTEAIEFPIPDKEWHHYTMSYKDGFFIDGKKIGDYGEGNLTETSIYDPICINGYYSNNKINADDFGMVIIDDTIFIPTSNGWLNTTTNELLPIVFDENGGYIYNKVEPEYDEPTGNLIKTVNVNVIPKIDVAKDGIKFGESTFSTIPEWADFSNVKDFSYMFRSCKNIQTISELPTHNATKMNYIFESCTNLRIAPIMTTNKVTDVGYMFWQCTALQQIPAYDFSNITSIRDMFIYDFYGNMDNLTDVGGFIGLSCSWDDNYSLSRCPNLTYQSCINILNGLADVTELGSRTLKVHPNFLTTVGEEINIGTNKGWIITA